MASISDKTLASDTNRLNRKAYETCIRELNIERFEDPHFSTSDFHCFDDYFKEGRDLWTNSYCMCTMPECGCIDDLSLGRYIATRVKIPKTVIEYLFSHGWLTKTDSRFLEHVMHPITDSRQRQHIVYLLTEFFDPEFVVNFRTKENATVMHFMYYAHCKVSEYWTEKIIDFLGKHHFDFHAMAGEDHEQSLLSLAIINDHHFDIYRYVHDFGLKFEETNESRSVNRFFPTKVLNACISYFLFLFCGNRGFMELYIREKKKNEPLEISEIDRQTLILDFERKTLKTLFSLSETIKLCYDLGYDRHMTDSDGHTLRYYVDLFSEIGHEWFGDDYDKFTSFM
jgi:hypothetical protein